MVTPSEGASGLGSILMSVVGRWVGRSGIIIPPVRGRGENILHLPVITSLRGFSFISLSLSLSPWDQPSDLNVTQ